MLSKSKPSFKKKQPPNQLSYAANSSSMIKRLCSRDMGTTSSFEFIVATNTARLNDLKLSKTRCIPSTSHSVTWLSLDSVENRFLLAARSDGRFSCFDTFQKEDLNSNLKLAFNLRNETGHSYSISCIQWYPVDSGMFFTSGMDQKLKVWDTNSLQVADEYNLKHKIYSLNLSMLMASSSKTLIALGLANGQVRFVDLNSGSYTHTLKAHPDSYCVCVQWSPYDSNILASAGSDGRVGIWDMRSARACLQYLDHELTKINHKTKRSSSSGAGSKPVAHAGPIIGLSYSPDGHHLVSLGKDNTLRLWDACTGLNTQVNYGRVPLSSAVAESSLQMSFTEMCRPNHVLVPSKNNLLMYDILEGELRRTYKGHFDAVSCSLYNPAQHEVYTGSRDRNVLVWSAEDASPRSAAADRPTKSMYSILSNTDRVADTGSRAQDAWSDDEA